MSSFPHTESSWTSLRQGYSKLSDQAKSEFWIHFAIAPLLILIGMIGAFGWWGLILSIGLCLFTLTNA